jgi:LmbE family N-acetylglucosaminyl deacetylase
VALEGLSRGGLNIYNWAAANPDKVACIYADAPVCDIKSWPGGLGKGPGDPASWAQCLKAYNLTPEQALTFKGNPIDNLEPLAKAGVPLLHVCGGADETVPIDENTRVLESRYKQLGGKIDVIIKPGVGHHPHSLKDPTPIVEFILKHTGQAEGEPAKKLRVVFFGAHCDDSELASGGLMVMLSQAGHEVFSAYGTTHRGERKINGQPEDTVRRGESTAACKILGATPKFFPYPHETLFADAATVEAVRKWFDEIKPDIVVTHWPMDTHPNHHVVSSLVWLCYDHQGRTSGQDAAAADAKPVRPSWNLYFNEVNTFTKTENLQTLGYEPQWYLDIEKVRDIKHQAIECLVSQNPAELWQVHDNMHCRRGEECGVKYAESYFLVEPKPGCPTLPVEFLRKK